VANTDVIGILWSLAVHIVHERLLHQRVRVALAGCGGSGAQMLGCLARMDIAMRALGHPHGLHVTVYDGDEVAETNVGRQVWSPSDIGINKAVAMVHRINMYYGLDWDAVPQHYPPERERMYGPIGECDILVSCVDTAAARRMMHRMIADGHGPRDYWLDLGNTDVTGQVVLGEVEKWRNEHSTNARLPFVTELFGELLDETRSEDARPSCSVRMSLQSQGLFVNDVVVRFAANLLYELFSRGKLTSHGAHINLATGRSAPINVDRETWARYGFVETAKRVARAP
jgi:PRTRC genetic system ThiF family protein